jgi:hypothetical protein
VFWFLHGEKMLPVFSPPTGERMEGILLDFQEEVGLLGVVVVEVFVDVLAPLLHLLVDTSLDSVKFVLFY